MVRTINWTPQAQEEYRNIVSYLLDTFGDAIAEKFTDQLAQTISSINMMPLMGRMHPRLSAVRQVVMRPYTVICYVVLPEQIIILNLLDSRQD